MKLYPGMEAEYEKRHNELWPEMQDMIHEYGGKNYTIFLDRETLVLYGYIEVEDRGEVGRERRYGDQPQMVGFHGGHHGNESGQQPGVRGPA